MTDRRPRKHCTGSCAWRRASGTAHHLGFRRTSHAASSTLMSSSPMWWGSVVVSLLSKTPFLSSIWVAPPSPYATAPCAGVTCRDVIVKSHPPQTANMQLAEDARLPYQQRSSVEMHITMEAKYRRKQEALQCVDKAAWLRRTSSKHLSSSKCCKVGVNVGVLLHRCPADKAPEGLRGRSRTCSNGAYVAATSRDA